MPDCQWKSEKGVHVRTHIKYSARVTLSGSEITQLHARTRRGTTAEEIRAWEHRLSNTRTITHPAVVPRCVRVQVCMFVFDRSWMHTGASHALEIRGLYYYYHCFDKDDKFSNNCCCKCNCTNIQCLSKSFCFHRPPNSTPTPPEDYISCWSYSLLPCYNHLVSHKTLFNFRFFRCKFSQGTVRNHEIQLLINCINPPVSSGPESWRYFALF